MNFSALERGTFQIANTFKNYKYVYQSPKTKFNINFNELYKQPPVSKKSNPKPPDKKDKKKIK